MDVPKVVDLSQGAGAEDQDDTNKEEGTKCHCPQGQNLGSWEINSIWKLRINADIKNTRHSDTHLPQRYHPWHSIHLE